ncbi:hypothetical protein PMAYCL1PPCAC_32096, partial [Pristionchus mayeri]
SNRPLRLAQLQRDFKNILVAHFVISLVTLGYTLWAWTREVYGYDVVWRAHLLVDASTVLTVIAARYASKTSTSSSFVKLIVCVAIHLFFAVSNSNLLVHWTDNDIAFFGLIHVIVSIGVVVFVLVKTIAWFKKQKQSKIAPVEERSATSKAIEASTAVYTIEVEAPQPAAVYPSLDTPVPIQTEFSTTFVNPTQ